MTTTPTIGEEWADYRTALRALPREAKDRLVDAPADRWLGAADARARWTKDGRYCPSAIAAGGADPFEDIAEYEEDEADEVETLRVQTLWDEMYDVAGRRGIECYIPDSANELTGVEVHAITVAIVAREKMTTDEWDAYAKAVHALPREAKDRLRSAPAEFWLKGEVAKQIWTKDGRYCPSALASASLADLAGLADPPEDFAPLSCYLPDSAIRLSGAELRVITLAGIS